jgi:hypothetical protein
MSRRVDTGTLSPRVDAHDVKLTWKELVYNRLVMMEALRCNDNDEMTVDGNDSRSSIVVFLARVMGFQVVPRMCAHYKMMGTDAEQIDKIS